LDKDDDQMHLLEQEEEAEPLVTEVEMVEEKEEAPMIEPEEQFEDAMEPTLSKDTSTAKAKDDDVIDLVDSDEDK
jgi:hypothetical protein